MPKNRGGARAPNFGSRSIDLEPIGTTHSEEAMARYAEMDAAFCAAMRAAPECPEKYRIKSEIGPIHRPAQKPVHHSMLVQIRDRVLCSSFGCWIVGIPRRIPIIPLHLQNRIKRIQEEVSKEMGVPVDEMISHRRTAKPVMARQIAMWFCKERTVHSYPEIGERFGGRDHTTALHAWRKIEKLRQSDPDLAYHIERIAAAL